MDLLPGLVPLNPELPEDKPKDKLLEPLPNEIQATLKRTSQAVKPRPEPAPVPFKVPEGFLLPGTTPKFGFKAVYRGQSYDIESLGTPSGPQFDYEAIQRRRERSPEKPRTLVGEALAAVGREFLNIPLSLADLEAATHIGGREALAMRAGLLDPFPPTRDDTAGRVANLVGGFIPQVVTGPVGFGSTTFSSTLERTDGDANTALGAGLVATALGVVPFSSVAGKIPGLRKTIAKYGESKTQELLATRTLEALITGASNIGQSYATEQVVRSAGYDPVELRPAEDFIVGVLGHAAVAGLGTLYERSQIKRTNEAKKILVENNVITPEESLLIAERPGLLAEVVLRRYQDQRVTLVPEVDVKGKVIRDNRGDVKVKVEALPDSVTWAEKVALKHNPGSIEAYRESLAKGGTRLFLEQTRLPPSAEEITSTKAGLKAIVDSVKPKLNTEDITKDGHPVTGRALLLRDANLLLGHLENGTVEVSRRLVDQAKALIDYSKKAPDSTERIDENISVAAATDPKVLSPIDLRPYERLSFPLEQTNKSGYLKSPEHFVTSPKIQSAVRRAQRSLVERLQVLRSATGLEASEKFLLSKSLDAEFVDKINTLLEKDNDNVKGARAKITKKIKESKAKDSDKVLILTTLDKAIDRIAKTATDETQRGTVERLIEDFSDPKYGETGTKALAILEDLHRQITTEESALPLGQRIEKVQTELATTVKNLALLEFVNARGKVYDSVVKLPEELSRPFLDSIKNSKNTAELTAVHGEIQKALDQYQLERVISKVEKLVAGESLNLNPRRDKVFGILKSLVPTKKAEPVETTQVVGLKIGDKVYKGRLEDTHADLFSRVLTTLPNADRAKIIDAFDKDQLSGYITSTGRFVNRQEAKILSEASNKLAPTKIGKAHEIEMTRIRKELKSSFGNLQTPELEAAGSLIEAFVRTQSKRYNIPMERFLEKISIQKGESNGEALFKIDVNHGSGAIFDKFSNKYLGTGEGGAKGYPVGMFFSSLESVARWYRKTYGKPASITLDIPESIYNSLPDTYAAKKEAAEFAVSKPLADAAEGLIGSKGPLDPAVVKELVLYEIDKEISTYSFLLSRVEKLIAEQTSPPEGSLAGDYTKSGYSSRDADYYREKIKLLKDVYYHVKDNNPTLDYHPGGAIYKATIELDPSTNTLDWNKKVQDQTPEVRTKFLEWINQSPELADFYRREPDHPAEYYVRAEWLLYDKKAPTDDLNILTAKNVWNFDTKDSVKLPTTQSLLAAGIRGITYIGRSSGVRNYVVFDDADIKINEVLYHKNKLGSFSVEDSRAVIRAIKAPTIEVLTHEIGHLFRHFLSTDDKVTAGKLYNVDPKIFDGPLTEARRAVEERIANDLVRYAREGKAPTPELKTVFEQFKSWLADIYKSLTVKVVKVKEVAPEVREFFDTLLTEPADPLAPSENQQSPLFVDPSTGKVKVDRRALRQTLESQGYAKTKYLLDRVSEEVRRGQIERGLYRQWGVYSDTHDSAALVNAIGTKPRSKFAQSTDSTRHAAGLVTDPVMFEAWLDQQTGGNKASPLYAIFHGNLVPQMSRHQQNVADISRFVSNVATRVLGRKVDTINDKRKFAGYLAEEIAPGITRDRAMYVYALSTDEGRVSDLLSNGAVVKGKTIDVEAALKNLSVTDRKFVDEIKAFYQNNPVIEKSLSNFLLFNGHLPQLVKGFFPSSRSPEKVSLEPDFGTFTTTLLNTIDNFKDRVENVDKPFELDRGFMSTFLATAERMSLFAELGKPLYRAQKALVNDGVKNAIVDRHGVSRYRSLELYLANIYGQVGHQRTAFDQAINYLTSAYAISRTALNVFSAAKQSLHLATLLADGTLAPRDIGQAIAEGAWADRAVGKRMQDNSGMAYQRYHGQFLRDMMVMTDDDRPPSRLSDLQHKSMILQRAMDRATMQIAWRASELSARRSGLRGTALREETVRLFDVAAGRDQPTSNPLYASELEIQAKRSPAIRGSLLFMREQNRVYNVVRRHVVRAVQNPTLDNIENASRALVFGVIGNALATSAINSLRRATYGKPQDETDIVKDVVGNTIGMFYLLAPTETLVRYFAGSPNIEARNLLGPISSMVFDGLKLTTSLVDLVTSGDERLKSGPSRGLSKGDRALEQAADYGFSLMSGVLGLPFWALWTQGKGLYTWTNDQYRLMTELEHERQTLKSQGLEGSSRYRDIEAAKSRINATHLKREKGLISDQSARREIENELRRTVR